VFCAVRPFEKPSSQSRKSSHERNIYSVDVSPSGEAEIHQAATRINGVVVSNNEMGTDVREVRISASVQAM
jgi:hypothetical protein